MENMIRRLDSLQQSVSSKLLVLQITLYRKGRMGTNHFLGETLVPLREVEEVDGDVKEADIRRYTLGRRSARDKVGSFAACMLPRGTTRLA